DEVIEDVLLLLKHSRLMPRLAIFPAAAHAGFGEHTAALHPRDSRGIKSRRRADAEPAISAKDAEMISIKLQALLHRDENRHLRAHSPPALSPPRPGSRAWPNTPRPPTHPCAEN